MVEYTCPWEPDDSAVGPGVLYLAAQVVDEPRYVEFGPEGCDQEGNLIEKPWAAELRDVWGDLQEHYADATFTEQRQLSIESFFRGFPWGGLRDLPVGFRQPFHLPVFGERHVDDPLDDSLQRVVDSVGLDSQGTMRIGFANGKDILEYPLAISRPTFGRGNTFLDGTRRAPRQRKHKGE